MFKNFFKLSPILLILVPFLALSLGGNIFFLLKTGGETDNLKAQIQDLQKNRDRQKAEKDQIRRFWEDQASLNDSLISGQLDVLTEVRNYFDEIGRSLRFVGTTPQILPTINQDNLRNVQNNLKDKIEKLEKKIDNNAQTKQRFTDQIDQISQNGGEDQGNRANPRDGVRN
jgi:cell division protein FtsB